RTPRSAPLQFPGQPVTPFCPVLCPGQPVTPFCPVLFPGQLIKDALQTGQAAALILQLYQQPYEECSSFSEMLVSSMVP
ncbi:unnamed protein product, partial [Gadus morhua 'NCC']